MRDLNQGDAVAMLTLEHYPGMTEKSIEEIIDQACERWPLFGVKVIHRVGPLKPADQIVFVVSPALTVRLPCRPVPLSWTISRPWHRFGRKRPCRARRVAG